MLEGEIYQWLESKGIPVPDYRVFEADEKMEVGFYPAVIKIQSPKVIHKSDVGGVIIDLQNVNDLIEARRQIISNLNQHNICIDRGDKFIVSHMCKGVELFFGIINDPVFERVIVFGAGGVYTELFKDVCFIDSEAAEEEIVRCILQTKISRIFTEGFRGFKYDIQPVINFIQKLQQLDVQEMDLNPVILQPGRLTVVDARLSKIGARIVHKKAKYVPGLFNPVNIAVIGASSHPEKVGYAIAKNASAHPGVLFVNPRLNTLFGKKVYHSISELPTIDTAVLAIPAPAIEGAIEELALKGAKHIIIITAGFKEAGGDEGFLTALAEKHNINIIGPNCLGAYMNGINLTFGASAIAKGEVNLFSQSGAILSELMDKAAAKKIGFENIVSVGNMAETDFGDLINSYTGANPLNLYVEGIVNGKNLLRAVRKSKSPVRIYKAGQTEAAMKAAFSHTGNLAGNFRMFCGLLKSAGANIIKDINGLLYPYSFNKILVITNAGGAGTILSDLISDKLYQLNKEETKLLNEVLPSNWSRNNPVDIIGDAGPERFSKALQVADQFNADAIYVVITPQFMTDAYAISHVFATGNFKTKIFPVLLGGEAMQAAKAHLQENGIPFFEELSEAVCFL